MISVINQIKLSWNFEFGVNTQIFWFHFSSYTKTCLLTMYCILKSVCDVIVKQEYQAYQQLELWMKIFE